MAPRGLRNNNPGNIRNSDVTDWKGEVPAGKKLDSAFEEFEDIAHGYRALMKLLRNYRLKHGCRSIADFISRWAPRTENNTSAYIDGVCRMMGVPSDFVPDVFDKDTMCSFAAAISRFENGVAADMSDVVAGWNLLS